MLIWCGGNDVLWWQTLVITLTWCGGGAGEEEASDSKVRPRF